MNNADLIVRLLRNAGIARGFGIPSGNVLPLMEAMRSGGIDFVLTAHEGSAGFAADVSARVGKAPGLCIATLGPGATNLATGVGNAWLDRSPMIAITCTLNEAQLGRRLQMWIDHHTLFRPITKATLRLQRGSIVATITEALRLAVCEPAGPVHLDLPEDVAVAAVSEPIPALAQASDATPAGVTGSGTGTGAAPGTNAAVSSDEAISLAAREAALARAHALLGSARRPIAIIGSNAMRMHSPESLRALIERHQLPFATTTMAKGLVDEDHPLSIGCIERARRQMQRALIASADLIIGLGYDTIEVEYEAWAGRVPVLHIDIETADVDASVTVAHQAIGPLDASIAHLASAAACHNAWTAAEIAAHRAAFQAALRPAAAGFTPHAAIDTVRRVLPREGILSFDVGAHTHQIGSQWTAHAPRSFLITNGWSSMGFGLPAAIAAKLERPDLPVVCLIGDGCFQMTCGEVAVLKRHQLAVPVVVLDDRWLSLIKVKQERRSLVHYGTELQEEAYREPPAHYFGVPAVGVRDAAGLEAALRRALAADGPTVIEAVVDAAHYSETVYD